MGCVSEMLQRRGVCSRRKIIGQWETERGHGSDAMADILGEAFRQIGLLREEWSLLDLADAIEFVSRGMLVVELHKDAPDENTWKPLHTKQKQVKHLSLAVVLHNGGVFNTIPNRGQMRRRKSEPKRSDLQDSKNGQRTDAK